MPQDVSDRETAHMVILSLCEIIGTRIRINKAMIKVMAMQLTYFDFHRFGHQTTLYNFTDISQEIYSAACRVFDEIWDGTPLRQITVHTGQVSQAS